MKKLIVALTLSFILYPFAFSYAFTRTSVVTDGFDTPANWTPLNPGNTTFNVSSSHFTSNHDAETWGGNPARWAGSQFNAITDQYAKSQIISISATGGAAPVQGAICRASADTDANKDLYFYRVLESATSTGSASRTTQIGSIKNGTITVHTTGSIVWAPNDTIEIECTGSSSTLLEGFKNGVSTGQTYTDSSSPLTTGRPGVLTNFGMVGDNFEGGSLAAGGGGGATPVVSRRRVQ